MLSLALVVSFNMCVLINDHVVTYVSRQHNDCIGSSRFHVINTSKTNLDTIKNPGSRNWRTPSRGGKPVHSEYEGEGTVDRDIVA